PRRFEIKAADVPNAAAVIKDGKRYILYNRDFISRVVDSTKTDWAAISIIAHEIGHHLNGDTLESDGSRPEIELDADRFSGNVLFKMGATLAQAQAAIIAVASEQATKTHPKKSTRLAAIQDGWITAQKRERKPDNPAP